MKIAVVLLAMGGPGSLESVERFLFNLFYDKAILRVANPFRFVLAKIISKIRRREARKIYAQLGGASPLLAGVQAQAKRLEDALNKISSDPLFKVFISMRYAPPFATEAVKDIENFAPDEIILLPLYPQFSTTTTQSSLADWRRHAKHLKVPTHIVLSYPDDQGFIHALSDLTKEAYAEAALCGKPRVLFSAHGLPQRIVKRGDPYPDQCAQTGEALQKALGIRNLDYVLCYQSKVGPMAWIGPSTEEEIKRAGEDKAPVVLVPISFVTECSETLVEIDRTYRALAMRSGVPCFVRVEAVGADQYFIDGLVQLVRDARTGSA